MSHEIEHGPKRNQVIHVDRVLHAQNTLQPLVLKDELPVSTAAELLRIRSTDVRRDLAGL